MASAPGRCIPLNFFFAFISGYKDAAARHTELDFIRLQKNDKRFCYKVRISQKFYTLQIRIIYHEVLFLIFFILVLFCQLIVKINGIFRHFDTFIHRYGPIETFYELFIFNRSNIIFFNINNLIVFVTLRLFLYICKY